MSTARTTPTFVLMGNQKYYPLLELNVACIRNVYPSAPILLYDWGDDNHRPRFAGSDASSLDANLTVVDWSGVIRDTSGIEARIPFAQQVDLAIRFNARFQRSWKQRLRKKLLKTVPGSFLARPMIRAGLVFENMIAQKIPCMADASKRVGAAPMVFLDADAFLLRPVDDVVARDDFDVAVTLIERPCWDVNNCSVINSGVIFYGSRQARRDAFLAEWQAACDGCDEWLREQTSLVRMLAALDRSLFVEGSRATVRLGGEEVAVLSLPQRVYNNTDHECLAAPAVPKVAHLANTAHNDRYLEELKQRLHQAVAHMSA